jgi:hypothetical protein
MENLYQTYAAKAKDELLKVAPANNEVIRHLELMTDLASVQI